MSREEQIVEMAKVMVDENNKEVTNALSTLFASSAEVLYNAGYRKASEVAEEIFAELDTFAITKVICNGEVKYDITNKYRALKEKYSCPSPDEKCLRVRLESRIEKIKKYGGEK